MDKFERTQAALRGQEVDKIPLNAWIHFSAVDQDSRSLAETQVAFAQKYNFDSIKLVSFGLYGVQDYGTKVKILNRVNLPPIVDDYGIHQISGWEGVKPLPAIYGSYDKQLQTIRHTILLVKKQFPVIQMIFSPLTTARELVGDRTPLGMKENPRLFKQALQALTETTIDFVKANIETGVDGFFFAIQCANFDFPTEEQYREFGEFYDRQVIAAYQDEAFFNMAYLYGDNGMFQLIADYSTSCINWHDRWSSLTLVEARKMTDKYLSGGIRETLYYDENEEKIWESILVSGSVADMEQHVQEAIAAVGDKGLIIGSGCVANRDLPEKNLYALCWTVYRVAALVGQFQKNAPRESTWNIFLLMWKLPAMPVEAPRKFSLPAPSETRLAKAGQ